MANLLYLPRLEILEATHNKLINTAAIKMQMKYCPTLKQLLINANPSPSNATIFRHITASDTDALTVDALDPPLDVVPNFTLHTDEYKIACDFDREDVGRSATCVEDNNDSPIHAQTDIHMQWVREIRESNKGTPKASPRLGWEASDCKPAQPQALVENTVLLNTAPKVQFNSLYPL